MMVPPNSRCVLAVGFALLVSLTLTRNDTPIRHPLGGVENEDIWGDSDFGSEEPMTEEMEEMKDERNAERRIYKDTQTPTVGEQMCKELRQRQRYLQRLQQQQQQGQSCEQNDPVLRSSSYSRGAHDLYRDRWNSWMPLSDEQLRSEWLEAESEREAVQHQIRAYRAVYKAQSKIGGFTGKVPDPVPGLIRKAGFEVRQYQTKTKDGYLLRLLNIVNPVADQSMLKRTPVVMGHGLQLTYNAFIIQSLKTVAPQPYPFPRDHHQAWSSSNRSLALYLSNHGFDVWLISARGADWSRDYDPEQLKHPYWDFSLDEQGLYDIPAHIDRVLELTKQEKVIYVGYSESTLFMFIQLIENPEFNNKIAAFFALAPIANMKHVSVLPRVAGVAVAAYMPQLNIEFFPPELNELLSLTSASLCSIPLVKRVCQAISSFGVGWSSRTDAEWQQFRAKWRPTSMKAWIHFSQLIKRGHMSTFERWDNCPAFKLCRSVWTASGCLALSLTLGGLPRLCRQHTPSRPYNLTRFTHPTTYLFMGMQDSLSTCEDVTDLYVAIKQHVNIKGFYALPDWNHLDLLFAIDVDRRINQRILDIMNSLVTQSQQPTVKPEGNYFEL